MSGHISKGRNDNRKLTICDNRILTTLSMDNIWDDRRIIPDMDVTVECNGGSWCPERNRLIEDFLN